MSATGYRQQLLGFSIAELMLAMAILAILAAIAIPAYKGYVQTSEMGGAVQEMKQIELAVENYKLDTGAYPNSLADIEIDMLDPWDNPYQYLRIEGAGNKAKGHQRKDHSLVPINSDFDLYSMGKDGKSSPPLTAASSQDDIVRANNGAYYGYGRDY
ncbi:MAG: prepilin-type N-terminal cleavage/methylation domain-containing protein [Candidatus Thiodiazotropha sp.]